MAARCYNSLDANFTLLPIFNIKIQTLFDPIVLRNHTSNQKTRTQSIHDAPQKNQHKNKTIFPTIHTKKLVTKGESVILPLFFGWQWGSPKTDKQSVEKKIEVAFLF